MKTRTFSLRHALLACGRPAEEADRLEAMCDQLRVGEQGRRALAQCCAVGRVKADDFNHLADLAPEILRNPLETRAAIWAAPLAWTAFVEHLRTAGRVSSATRTFRPLERIVLRLLHWWRLRVEPDSNLMTGVGRWRVRYTPCRELPGGGVSSGMSYRQACCYADIFDGTVERAGEGSADVTSEARNGQLHPPVGHSVVRRNLMTRPGYSPYCGNGSCSVMPRTVFNGRQFSCACCGWESEFPSGFIAAYKAHWSLPNDGGNARE